MLLNPLSAQDGPQTKEVTQLKKSAVLGLKDSPLLPYPPAPQVESATRLRGRQDQAAQDFSLGQEQN